MPLLLSSARYADRLGLISAQRWLNMDQLQRALLPIHVERGVNDSVLIIAFSGGAQRLSIPVHQFFEITKLLGYSRILLRDKHEMHYHYGVDRKRRDWPTLLEYLKNQINDLSPRKVICVGTSSGGYAALVAGHHLRADWVHAFGAQTFIGIDPESLRTAVNPRNRRKLYYSKRAFREALDLAPVLQKSNGKTTYFLHYCAGHEADRRFAEHVADLPSVVTFGYPCSAHAVAVFLAKKQWLGKLLELDSQYRLAEVVKSQFGGEVLITPRLANEDRPTVSL
jgi:hypothetical protein